MAIYNLLLIIKSALGDVRRWVMKTLVGLIPKDKNLILFSAWFGEKYADSSMYLFEYMIEHGAYKLFWYTKNFQLYKSLRMKNIPVVYSKTMRAKWYQSRAIMLLSSVQTYDYNPFYLNRCIFFDLDHGFPGKPVGLAQPTVTKQWKKDYYYRKKGLSFYQTAASRFAADMQCAFYDLDYSHQIFANKPRIDVLFDKNLQKGKNIIVDHIKNGRRAIVYLPTHRACGNKHINLLEVLDLPSIQRVCEDNNTVFIIKKHFYHREEIEDLSRYSHIFDITREDIDTQVLLSQTDILITDFSSCFNDFLALNRPIVFYAYDYDEYLKNERDYYWKYEKIDAGYTAKDKSKLNDVLIELSRDWSDKEHLEGRIKMRRVYFDDDVEMGTSREKLCGIIGQLINGTYIPFDWNTKAAKE